jgi:hypothetical protein
MRRPCAWSSGAAVAGTRGLPSPTCPGTRELPRFDLARVSAGATPPVMAPAIGYFASFSGRASSTLTQKKQGSCACMAFAEYASAGTRNPHQPKTNVSRHVSDPSRSTQIAEHAKVACARVIRAPIASTALTTTDSTAGALARRDDGSNRSSALAAAGTRCPDTLHARACRRGRRAFPLIEPCVSLPRVERVETCRLRLIC